MSINTGGPAFPIQEAYALSTEQGMTLRDYFAAKAMQAFLMRQSSMTAPDEMIAEAAYDTADAMLKAREASK